MEICIGRWKALEEDKEEMNTEELARLALISGKKTTEIVTK